MKVQIFIYYASLVFINIPEIFLDNLLCRVTNFQYCVCFKTLDQGLLNKVDPNWSAIEHQTAVLEIVLQRLAKRTTFEIEGWKRILAIRDIFNELNLDIDNYKLEIEKVEFHKFKVSEILKYSRDL